MRQRLNALFDVLGMRVRRWSLRRHPRQRTITLTQKRIYILPSAAGFGFLLLLVLLLLLAINYENNLVYGLTFLLAGLFVVSILHTYGNLAGLELSAVAGHDCFCGEAAGFALQLRAAPGREHEQLRLSWDRGTPRLLDLTDERERQIELALPTDSRGPLDPGPLRLETSFPLGFFRAWTWIDTGLTALVYPQPQPCRLPQRRAEPGDSGTALLKSLEHDEFQGLARYQRGASVRQIAWKTYARGQGLFTKEYASPVAEALWLEWDSWPGVDTETRLSRLCFWALELAQGQQPYGLRLPGVCIEPDWGEGHRRAVLRALALYGQSPATEPPRSKMWREGR